MIGANTAGQDEEEEGEGWRMRGVEDEINVHAVAEMRRGQAAGCHEMSTGTAVTTVACMALGSRGDAEPLLVVLERCVGDGIGVHARFACRPGVWAELVDAAGRDGVPEAITHVPVRDCSVAMSIALAARRKGLDPQDAAGAEGITAQEAEHFARAERGDMQEAARGARLVLCNMFSLEGVHIAEALGVRCVILSPCLPPCTGAPAGFEAEFAAQMPTLYRRLKTEQQRQRWLSPPLCRRSHRRPAPLPLDPHSLLSADARCSWDDVETWMWRLFLDDHGEWRERALGLPAVPLEAWDAPSCSAPLPCRCPLLVGVSPSLAARVLSARVAASSPGKPDHSNDNSQREEEDDDSHLAHSLHSNVAICCGPWQRERILSEASSHAHGNALPADLWMLLSGTRCRADTGEPQQAAAMGCVCIGFGSMASLGLIDVRGWGWVLLQAIMGALGREGLGGVWLLQGWPASVVEALRALSRKAGRAGPGELDWDFITVEAVAHDALLPECVAMIHHGGAGTVAACVRAGCAQIIVPFAFDQHEWAASLAMGRSPGGGGDAAIAVRLARPQHVGEENDQDLEQRVYLALSQSLALAGAREHFGETEAEPASKRARRMPCAAAGSEGGWGALAAAVRREGREGLVFVAGLVRAAMSVAQQDKTRHNVPMADNTHPEVCAALVQTVL